MPEGHTIHRLAADLGGDSWVTLGDPKTHNTAFSPNFLGGNGMDSVIKGTRFVQLDNGGYFDENPGSMELPDGNAVQISQCPNGHGKIKSPLCCGQDMSCSIA